MSRNRWLRMMSQVKPPKSPEFKVGDIVRIVADIGDIYSYKDMRCFVEEVINKNRIDFK